LKNLDLQILARYLADTCTEEEKEKVQRWVKKDLKNKQLLDEYENIWNKAETTITSDNEAFDPVENWPQLEAEIVNKKGTELFGTNNYTKNKGRSIKQSLMRVAAIFIAAIFLGYLTYQITQKAHPEQKQEPILQEITTQNGQQSRLTLSEGTNILLNAGSKIEFPKFFEEHKREVYLEGQAYFDVAEDPERPFLIHINGTMVQVLGTEFSVRAYPEDKSVQVVVKKGRVSLKTESSAEPKSALVTANELAKYDEKNDKLIAHPVKNIDLYLGWINGTLNFKEARMSKVAIELERRFDVDVSFRDQEIKTMKLTAHLKSKRIKNVLDIIAFSLKIKYDLDHNKVTFYKH